MPRPSSASPPTFFFATTLCKCHTAVVAVATASATSLIPAHSLSCACGHGGRECTNAVGDVVRVVTVVMVIVVMVTVVMVL